MTILITSATGYIGSRVVLHLAKRNLDIVAADLDMSKNKDKLENKYIAAGHDLNLENLPALKALNLFDEVSIGHAIIVDALNFGFEDTIKRYIQITKG